MERPIQSDGRLHGAIVGCRRDDGCWLLIQRSEHVAAPGKICFPGGAIEVGEDPLAAAQREIYEEVGAQVSDLARVWHFQLPERPLTLWGFCAVLADPNALRPDPQEVADILWLTCEEVCGHPDVLPHTDIFLQALEAHLAEEKVAG